jgi:hypothetical protein
MLEEIQRHQKRLAVINEELTRMQFITTEEATGTITTNFSMMVYHMPEGTMDAALYKSKVHERNDKMHSIRRALTPPGHQNRQNEATLIARLQEERMALYNILVNVTPINTEVFQAKLASLIDEKISIITSLRMLQIEGMDVGEIF